MLFIAFLKGSINILALYSLLTKRRIDFPSAFLILAAFYKISGIFLIVDLSE